MNDFAAANTSPDSTVREQQSALDSQLLDRKSSRYQLAMTGRGLISLQKHHQDCLPYLIMHTKVFARMKPSDKQYIVEELMQVAHDNEVKASIDNNSDGTEKSLVAQKRSYLPLPKLQVMVYLI